MWLLACGGPDPDLVAQRDAIAAWQVGQDALERGDADEALRQFEQAAGHRPKDALLVLWQAEALASSGQTEAAIARLDRALELAPGLPLALYNRGALKLRLGQIPEGAADIKRGLALDGVGVEQVLQDPDVRPHLGHPALSFLPSMEPDLHVTLPEGPVFWGSQVRVEATVSGLSSPEMSGQVVGPVAQVSSVVDHRGEGIDARWDWSWTLVVRGRGDVALGPFEARSGSRTAAASGGTLVADAPPDKSEYDGANTPRQLVSALAVQNQLAITGARMLDGELWVRMGPSQRLQGLARPPDQRHEVRRDGQVQWVAHQYRDLQGGPFALSILQAGQPVWSGEVLGEPGEGDGGGDGG